jgi:hypothetical protein
MPSPAVTAIVSREHPSRTEESSLRVPPDVIKAQCARYRQHGKAWHRPRLQNLDDHDIGPAAAVTARLIVRWARELN